MHKEKHIEQKKNGECVSVIVPVYQAEKYLHRCVDSIRRQTYNNLEIILVDDCSTDHSPKICDKYAEKDERIKVIHMAKNSGISKARNAGIKYGGGGIYMLCGQRRLDAARFDRKACDCDRT